MSNEDINKSKICISNINTNLSSKIKLRRNKCT